MYFRLSLGIGWSKKKKASVSKRREWKEGMNGADYGDEWKRFTTHQQDTGQVRLSGD